MREPVSRAYSQYLSFYKNKGKEKIEDFEVALEGPFHDDYINKSLYYPQLERLINTFGIENIKIIIFENLISDPLNAFRDLFNFLGVDSQFIPNLSESKINQSYSEANISDFINRMKFRLRRFKGIDRGSIERFISNPVGKVQQISKSVLSSKSKKLTREQLHALQMKYFKKDIICLEKKYKLDLPAWNNTDK